MSAAEGPAPPVGPAPSVLLAPAVLRAERVTKEFGGLRAVDDVSVGPSTTSRSTFLSTRSSR